MMECLAAVFGKRRAESGGMMQAQASVRHYIRLDKIFPEFISGEVGEG